MKKVNKEKWLEVNETQKLDNLKNKFKKLLKYLLSGQGFNKYEKEESLYRYFLRKPIPFKIICRFLQWQSKKYISSPNIFKTDDQDLLLTINYTLKQISINNVSGSNRRMQNYYHLAQCFLKGDLKDKKLLIVGPKFITELFLAWTYGFNWRNIFAIDIICNHPKIKLMDVDNLKFDNLKFDCISMANVFGYNKNPKNCIEGISKYLNKDGILVFNSSEHKNKDIENIPLSSKINSNELKELLEENKLTVISSEICKDNETAISSIWVARKV